MEIVKIFPVHIREALANDTWKAGLEEIRVRVGSPLEFIYGGESRYLPEHARNEAGKKMLGMAGQVVKKDGKVTGLSHITFLNVRIAHEKRGCADDILPHIRRSDGIYNTLMLSPPGIGKTTFLRDLIRQLSAGDAGAPGMKVGVVDERSEIAACHLGIPQNDLGPRTDVLDGCKKTEGIRMLLRSMSPQILAVDELGGKEDFAAVKQALCCGCRVLGTVHAGCVQELLDKPYLQACVTQKLFGRYILIERNSRGERSTTIYDERMERIC